MKKIKSSSHRYTSKRKSGVSSFLISRSFLFLLILFLIPGSLLLHRLIKVSAQTQTITGLAILGDSAFDEYRADDNRGGTFSATTLNAVEQLTLKKGINIGSWGSWGGPRRVGYKYNWAKSGATTGSLLSEGQHTGVAAQIQAGEVSHVFFHIGTNDFVNYVYPIYSNSISQQDIDSLVNTMATNVTTAIDTITAAGPSKIVMTGAINAVDSIYMSNDFAIVFPDPVGRARINAAFVQYNDRVRQIALARNIPYVDPRIDALDEIKTERADAQGKIVVGGELIDPAIKGNEPHHVLLDDPYAHAGTVISGLLANKLLIEPFNTFHGTNITSFTDEDILITAGILQPSPTATVAPTSTPSPIPTQSSSIRLGVMSDSTSDEYRANDNRAGSTIYAATTLNWTELLEKYRGIDLGPWGSRSEPRRIGYEYNWARSGAKAQDVVTSGQHTGIASQAQAGLIDVVYFQIGNNDFAYYNDGAAIYNGTISGQDLTNKIDAVVSNITIALDTVLASNPNVKVVLGNIPDPGQATYWRTQFPDASKRQLVTDAILQTNAQIQSLSTSRQRVTFFDLYLFGTTLLSRVDASGNLIVGNEAITLLSNSNEPHHAILADNVHGGTVIEGLISLAVIDRINTALGSSIPQFSDSEILANAGIVASSPTPLPTNTPVPTNTPSPVPTATSTPTPLPTNTPVPTNTPLPTASPTPTPTPSPSIAFIPSLYTITTGSFVSGNLASLSSDNNNYLVVKSTTSGFTRTNTTQFQFSAVPTGKTTLTVEYRAKSNGNNRTDRISIFDNTTQQWTEIDSFSLGTSETLRTKILTSPNRYINAQGNVNIRSSVSAILSTNQTSHELVKITLQ